MTLILAVGAHWAILQSVAWFGMAVTYSHDGSLKDAIVKTFDGKHPCKLCQLVADGKKAEHKEEAQTQITKIDFLLGTERLVIYPPALERVALCPLGPTLSRTEIPPLPPPRLA